MKTFQFKKNNLQKGDKYTVRTKGLPLFTGKGIVLHHKEEETGKFNVYIITRCALDKLSELYMDFVPKFQWDE